jgi:hypothetical protein
VDARVIPEQCRTIVVNSELANRSVARARANLHPMTKHQVVGSIKGKQANKQMPALLLEVCLAQGVHRCKGQDNRKHQWPTYHKGEENGSTRMYGYHGLG